MTDQSKFKPIGYDFTQLRKPPKDALKEIKAGRLKGKSDINPQWRYDIMNETFGPCGMGWNYQVTKQWIEQGSDNQQAAFVNVELRYKIGSEWSEPIPGSGGSMFVANERGGAYTSDEAFKMATTDALSVAMKMIGVAADVYRGMIDGSKYSKPEPTAQPKPKPKPAGKPRLSNDGIEQAVIRISGGELTLIKQIKDRYQLTDGQMEYLEQAEDAFNQKMAAIDQEMEMDQDIIPEY